MDEQLKSLTHQLTELTETIRNDGVALEGHSEQLSQLTDAANTFAKLTRSPFGHVSEIMTNVVLAPSMALFIKWGAFTHIPRGDTISYQTLAERLGADTALISMWRILHAAWWLLYI
ncbi:hypothetical protein IMZ48_16575, partial [Candidatus Bathyarchaeota archaeon]|nr:hypothetical protein [Candidatus Bathyarchaeota archaeon]